MTELLNKSRETIDTWANSAYLIAALAAESRLGLPQNPVAVRVGAPWAIYVIKVD
ncbi:uncharacterized protein PHALS_05589 [Plasmopara halstedii]|uniref:Uncharacterized protein n=1 Tax=Plasmopara halstedii TaxID=4781 RepID=A0A0N7L7V3_PLAHL|nr:uncharacterized protein PHALS_05589 [Plasmopara halstedii]CEG48115.1 hypothetical protein PHALS_05589 [Plasmopara halstedii]|eukprot:XP_024584484.1 hypothetical protein PHALS_05589 [Plasmopara halstedii]